MTARGVWAAACWSVTQNRKRAVNRLVDAVAWSAGYCMATTWRPDVATYKPGFKHWRCWKPRKHAGPHRTGSYRWHSGQQPVWDPLPVNLLVPETPGVAPHWARALHHPVGTRRRDRITERVAQSAIRSSWADRPAEWGGWLAADPGVPLTGYIDELNAAKRELSDLVAEARDDPHCPRSDPAGLTYRMYEVQGRIDDLKRKLERTDPQ